MKTFCFWVQASAADAFNDWWPKFLEAHKWPTDLVVERWGGQTQDFRWTQVFDSLSTFSLFKQTKVILISDADKAIKQHPSLSDLQTRLTRGPHRVVLLSEASLPAKFSVPSWEYVSAESQGQSQDDKAGFRWIDAIHRNELTVAMSELDLAIRSHSHPFALLQLLNRDIRLGRLIHYAFESRFREDEIASRLRLPSFAVRKWLQRGRLKKAQWSHIFDRMFEADLEMKSGADPVWALRRVTLDLVKLIHTQQKISRTKLETVKSASSELTLWSSKPQLWQVLPSFA